MSKYEDDARFSLFGPRTKPKESLTSSDADPNQIPGLPLSAESRGATKTLWDGESVDDPADVEYDRTWHVILVQLLGRLEHGRASLEDPAHVRDPAGAVRIAAAMVNQVADFIATHVDPQKYSRPIADSLAAAGRFLTAAQVAGQSAGKRGFLGLFGGNTAERAGKLQECMWVLRDMPLVLERYFVLLSGCFHGRKPALEWLETSGVYIGELKRALGWVEGFTP
jgi:hypothetical protein